MPLPWDFSNWSLYFRLGFFYFLSSCGVFNCVDLFLLVDLFRV